MGGEKAAMKIIKLMFKPLCDGLLEPFGLLKQNSIGGSAGESGNS